MRPNVLRQKQSPRELIEKLWIIFEKLQSDASSLTSSFRKLEDTIQDDDENRSFDSILFFVSTSLDVTHFRSLSSNHLSLSPDALKKMHFPFENPNFLSLSPDALKKMHFPFENPNVLSLSTDRRKKKMHLPLQKTKKNKTRSPLSATSMVLRKRGARQENSINHRTVRSMGCISHGICLVSCLNCSFCLKSCICCKNVYPV